VSPALKAIIDIGSNSIVLIVAQRDRLGWNTLRRRKSMAKLGAKVTSDNQLSSEAQAGLAELLQDYIGSAKQFSTEPKIYATASLRNVRNGGAVAKALSEQLETPVRILSEAEEASFAWNGVWAAQNRPAEPMVVVDIGGGSSEVAWGGSGSMQGFVSLATGAVRLGQPWSNSDPLPVEHVSEMRQRLERMLRPLRADIPKIDTAYACSGSIRRLCRMAGTQELSAEALDGLIELLISKPLRSDRLSLIGMDPERVDTILPAALIHQALAAHYGWKAYRLSAGGLRWGLLEA
jgi:exopolyphosphatase/guanosine-5'-triphosphate,3'-diphosphate pyrophosphatase